MRGPVREQIPKKGKAILILSALPMMGDSRSNIGYQDILIEEKFENFIPFSNPWSQSGTVATMQDMQHTQTHKPKDLV